MQIRTAAFPVGVLALTALVGLLGNSGRSAEKTPRPNILYILADDLGWADVGFHGGEIKTPHLDKLAASGARLEQYYVQSVCSPTRGALLTGRYPIRLGLQVGVVRPWAQYGLPLEERTLPQALGAAGYETAIVGKWHLGHFQPAYLPTHRGLSDLASAIASPSRLSAAQRTCIVPNSQSDQQPCRKRHPRLEGLFCPA